LGASDGMALCRRCHSCHARQAVRYKLVIFDFDGTLANSIEWVRGVINDVARRYRFRTLDAREFEEVRGKDTRAALAYLGISIWKVPFIARHMRSLMAGGRDGIELFPGVHELLEQLSQSGVMMAIVSSNSEENVRRILGAENAARIAFYACSVGLFGKRSQFKSIVRRSGIAAQSAIAIGDEVRDLEAAAGAGIDAGAVGWGYATPDRLRAHRPTALFQSIAEMLDRLTR
jgi:phosphoglycolate phosphatase